MTLQTGNLLYNRYRIDQVIAYGGMGAIYRAYDMSLGVQVALKENIFGAEEPSRQFRHEATLLAGLRHPNLPRVTDHFTITGQGQYLVMDFIEGEDLKARLDAHGALPEAEVIAIGTTICQALTYLHTRQPPILHRDVKPGNIKITPAGVTFLVDFGLAREAFPGQSTTTGARAVTPGYASPEQYGQGTTPLSDVYSLGATLYAALTGKVPEDGLMRAMGSVQLTPVRKHNPDVSERTARIVEKAMEVRPADRYESAEALRLALVNAPPASPPSYPPLVVKLEGSPDHNQAVTIRRDSSAPPLTSHFPTVATPQVQTGGQAAQTVPRLTSKRRALVTKPVAWLAGLFLLLVLAGGGYLIWQHPITNSPVPTQSPFAGEIPTRLAAVFTELPPTLAESPPVKTAPVAATTLLDPTQSATATSTTPPATQTPAPTFTPASTPLGGGSGQLAFASLQASQRPQIWIVNADGSDAHPLTSLQDGACQPAWSPDGTRLVFITPCTRRQDEYLGAVLYIMDADGSHLQPLPSMPGGDFDPAWSPDGEQIAFTSLREGAAHIFSVQLSNLQVVRLTGAYSDDRRPAWSPDGDQIAFESTRLGGKQIWLMNADGSSPAEFTLLAEGPAYNPVWSGDGRVLFYNRDNALPWIYARRVDVPHSPEARVTDQRPCLRPRISTDGSWMAFESWGASHQIYRMRTTGIDRQAVTSGDNLAFDPVWQP